MIGQTVSHFRITAKLGEGGMGEVYRAEDVNLDREVAIKVLPESFVADPERLARFQREAKLLAALNHPNVAAIYELASADDRHFLVLELVEGQDLAERLGGGPLPVEEALPVARQIAEALQAAHAQGIVHRDLKPANVKVTPEGTVKVLDFGLAKAWETDESDPNITHSPTMTAQMTRAGVILGTAAYMSPEQAKGRAVDKRADIWSFGVILYELLTGRMLFGGETVTDSLAAVVRAEPDWKALPDDLPLSVQRLLRRCLAKDPAERLHDIADARLEIRDAMEGRELVPEIQPRCDATASNLRPGVVRPLLGIVGGLAVGLALGYWLWAAGSAPRSEARARRVSIQTQPLLDLGIAISPDGSEIVYRTSESGPLMRRSLYESVATPIAGTEGGEGPGFSPDGRALVFQWQDQLKRVPVSGGTALTLASLDLTLLPGAAWAEDGWIYYVSPPEPNGYPEIRAVPEQGGESQVLVASSLEDGSFRFAIAPTLVPGGRHLLFTELPGHSPLAATTLKVLDLASGVERVLLDGFGWAYLAASGPLLVSKHGSWLVHAVAFDRDRAEISGPPTPLAEGLVDEPNTAIELAADGTLAHTSRSSGTERSRIVRIDREGGLSPILEAEAEYQQVEVSPDGKWLAIGRGPRRAMEVLILDLQRGALTPILSGANELSGWSPDSRSLFVGRSGGSEVERGIFRLDVSGSSEPQRIVAGEWLGEGSVTPDGKTLLYCDNSYAAGQKADIWRVEFGQEPEVLLRTPHDEQTPMVSPDGRLYAYSSNPSGAWQVFLRRLDGAGGAVQVSTGGGNATQPRWSRDGRTLYYLGEAGLMAVGVGSSDPPEIGHPLEVVAPAFASAPNGFVSSRYDVVPDGSGFVLIHEPEPEPVTHINVILDFIAELENTVSGR